MGASLKSLKDQLPPYQTFNQDKQVKTPGANLFLYFPGVVLPNKSQIVVNDSAAKSNLDLWSKLEKKKAPKRKLKTY